MSRPSSLISPLVAGLMPEITSIKVVLPGAVRAADANHVACVYVEIEVVHRRQRVEILEDVTARQQRCTFPGSHPLDRIVMLLGR